MSPDATNLLQGTLDMMILKALALHEMHGLGISRRIEQITKGTFQVKPGSLFPALHRMEEEGWIKAKWVTTENKRRARLYEITAAGRKRLGEQEARWRAVTSAVGHILQRA